MNKETLRDEDLGEIIKKYVNHFTIAHDPNYFEKIKSIRSEIMSLISQSESKEQSEFGPVDLTNVEPDKFNLKIKEDSK